VTTGESPDKTFFIDTNSLYQCARRFDDLDRFALVWGPLAELVSQGRLRTVEQVAKECGKKSALLGSWIDGLADFAIPTSDLWAAARKITNRWTELAGEEPGEAGDPWLIAAAERHNQALGLLDALNTAVIVTEEVARKKSQRVTRIPEACDLLGIECTDLWGMFQREGWQVGLVRFDPGT
jgi:hypothetical protein